MRIVDVENLWKVYNRRKEALRGISFHVESGEIFALLGPNGAGKTTTVKILSCITKPTSGKVEVMGYSVPDQCSKVREKVGVVPQEFQGFSDLTVEENIKYFVKLYRGEESQVEELMKSLDLLEYRKTRFRNLSGGYKRRVAIACSLAGDPKLLFMDEPTVGLDPRSRRDVWNLITEVKRRGISVLLTTHYLDEAQKLSDRIGIIFNGKIVRLSTPGELMEEFRKQTLEEAYLALMESLGDV
ncbi:MULTISPECIES: ABC transporter ATP-binding protein [Metallosphaera]|uniref:ABC transporter ATP-binding protein n=1 Tax=Metallosphaera TaxID=41980 RepID=UPI001F053524|nr:ABC transporter ATP-binding protein [Metallosphaera sedula]MCH1772090.1 ABC transporter ATP-binding protein [Metallosphaera sedula]MCP6729902.1 ABC transporter ATP-binding protein [Metallosphaera sedula]BBL46576.1 multidrug ABC transporter ATPase [Metallosphaera sedula]